MNSLLENIRNSIDLIENEPLLEKVGDQRSLVKDGVSTFISKMETLANEDVTTWTATDAVKWRKAIELVRKGSFAKELGEDGKQYVIRMNRLYKTAERELAEKGGPQAPTYNGYVKINETGLQNETDPNRFVALFKSPKFDFTEDSFTLVDDEASATVFSLKDLLEFQKKVQAKSLLNWKSSKDRARSSNHPKAWFYDKNESRTTQVELKSGSDSRAATVSVDTVFKCYLYVLNNNILTDTTKQTDVDAVIDREYGELYKQISNAALKAKDFTTEPILTSLTKIKSIYKIEDVNDLQNVFRTIKGLTSQKLFDFGSINISSFVSAIVCMGLFEEDYTKAVTFVRAYKELISRYKPYNSVLGDVKDETRKALAQHVILTGDQDDLMAEIIKAVKEEDVAKVKQGLKELQPLDIKDIISNKNKYKIRDEEITKDYYQALTKRDEEKSDGKTFYLLYGKDTRDLGAVALETVTDDEGVSYSLDVEKEIPAGNIICLSNKKYYDGKQFFTPEFVSGSAISKFIQSEVLLMSSHDLLKVGTKPITITNLNFMLKDNVPDKNSLRFEINVEENDDNQDDDQEVEDNSGSEVRDQSDYIVISA